VRIASVLVLASACRITAPFECELDEQCRAGGVQGTCHFEKYCAFPDAECASGQRYADNAGDDLAGTCIGGSPPIDDAGVDAPPFDVAMCPASYTEDLGNARSKYRLITTQANIWTHAAACAADLPGATHLVVIDDAAERDALRETLPVFPIIPPHVAYVGVVQDPAATSAKAGWIHFDGRAVAPGLWATNEPNNNGEPETTSRANVADLNNASDGMQDNVGTAPSAAFCECDGVPVHPMAQAFLDGDPAKP
jgi:hypothetical protein